MPPSGRSTPGCATLGRAEYTYATDDEALDALQRLSELEGIIPALESAHAVAEAIKRAPQMSPEQMMIVNISGRGDKDMHTVAARAGTSEGRVRSRSMSAALQETFDTALRQNTGGRR